MKNRLRICLILFCAFVAVTSVVSLWVYQSAKTARVLDAQKELQLLMDLRRGALAKYLGTVRSEAILWSSQKNIQAAVRDFARDWRALGDDAGETLRRLYITENQHPVGKKQLLDAAEDGSAYSETHREYHPWLRRFLEHQGYYDVFLFDRDGNLIYSVFKEDDYGTNMNEGPWKDTGLARAFRGARNASEGDKVAFEDFAPYGPSHAKPASFLASPIWSEGRPIGVLALQKSIDKINSIMHFTAGMGETGETYIVGADLLMRSDSRFSDNSTILEKRVETPSVERALGGRTGVQITPDYRGVPVLSAYGPLDFEGVTWAVVAEIDATEISKRPLNVRRFAVIGLLVVSATGALFGFIVVFLLAKAEKPTAWTED